MSGDTWLRPDDRPDGTIPEPHPDAPAAQGYVGRTEPDPAPQTPDLKVETDASGSVVVRATKPAAASLTVVRNADGTVTVRGAT